MLRNEETNPIRQQLAIERVIECSGSTFLDNALGYNNVTWCDISNHRTKYDLRQLLDEGWIIVNTAVSTALSVSHNGYDRRLDHTILTLEKYSE